MLKGSVAPPGDAASCRSRPSRLLRKTPFLRDAIASERAARLWRAIDALPEKLRVVTVLAAIEGHGVREVAALLGIPDGTVKSRLFDARQKLQELLR